ncbi:MAG: hypothetical protein DHS20C15_23450 [Planctomycetota bacterium]|nr:MAG: hypothetical protein DHS20C15_23450 [Planctomycetota bacterium]
MSARPRPEASAATPCPEPSEPSQPPDDSEVPELGPLISEPHRERPLWQRVVLIVIAVLAFAAGVVGWLVPVITGIPFYVVGLVCLAKVSPWMATRINRLDERLSPRWRRGLRWRPSWWPHEAAP